MKEKTYVNDIDRSIYDVIDEEKDAFRLESGLSEEVVKKISEEKNDRTGCEISVCSHLKYITKCLFPTGALQ